jgi:hypothetical protein
MHARRWDERGQRGKELEGGHDAVGGAVGAGSLHAIGQVARRQAAEALAGEGRAQAVTADALETGAIAGRDVDVGVEGEALDAGTAWTMHWKVKTGTRRRKGSSVDLLQGVSFEPDVRWIETPEQEQGLASDRPVDRL